MMGQIVPTVKDNVSQDILARNQHNWLMSKNQPSSTWRDEFIQRTKVARSARYSTKEMAKVLGIEEETYRKYEHRSALRHDLVEKFCIATGVAMEWLFTGKGRGPALESQHKAA
jgi:hypothetical protein